MDYDHHDDALSIHREHGQTSLANTSCQRCTARRKPCNRKLPRCRTCQNLGATCAGFGTKLTWQPGFSLDRKPVKKTIRRAPRHQDSLPRYEFVNHGIETWDDNLEDFRDVSTAVAEPESLPGVQGQLSDREAELFTHIEVDALSPLAFASYDPALCDTIEPETEIAEGPRHGPSTASDPSNHSAASLSSSGNSPSSPLSSSLRATISRDSEACDASEQSSISSLNEEDPALWNQQWWHQELPPGVLYDTQYDRLESIFKRYNAEFCVIPLTFDLPVNPFRYRTEILKRSPCLLHAVLALACHHADRNLTPTAGSRKSGHISEVSLSHGRHALQLFRHAFDWQNVSQMGSALLDTIIVLFSFDEAYSLMGNWSTYLSGAQQIIQVCGGTEAWLQVPRSTVQLALLIWWDAIISLVHRTPCVFSYEQFEAVLAASNDDIFTFFGLVGCPRSLVTPVVQLAHLAAEKQQSAHMRWVTFDSSLVTEIEQFLQAWCHEHDDDVADERSMHHDMDRLHASEAWRHGLLLYLYRVFRWRPSEALPVSHLRHARHVLSHVCACGDDQYMTKMAALPLFFAGCELADPWARRRIVELYAQWNERTRYHMYSCMTPLLEDVWAAQKANGMDAVWWGQVVERRASGQVLDGVGEQICFG